MAANAPAVATIAGVTPGLRNGPVGAVSVTFTEPIDAITFGVSALSLTEDGGPNLIAPGSGVTIAQQGLGDLPGRRAAGADDGRRRTTS